MSAKPIVVIKVVSKRYSLNNESKVISELSYILQERMPDYHVFVLPQDDHEQFHDPMEFKVFYEKDQQPIYHEELKQLIKDSIKPDIQL